MPTVSVEEAKSHLSELLAKSATNNEMFIITRRNKPLAALRDKNGFIQKTETALDPGSLRTVSPQ